MSQQLHFTHSNNPDASVSDVIVLLHGLFGMAKNLGSVARALSASYQVYAFDLPNHGRSPHSPAMTIDSMADDIVFMLDTLGLGTITLLGHSLGGKVAMSLALRYPNRVAKLIVADIAPVQYPPHHNTIIAALESIDLAACKTRADVNTLLAATINEEATRQFLLQNLAKQAEGFYWRMNVAAIKNSYQDLSAAVEMSAGIHAFSKPCLFIGGEYSDYLIAEYEPAIRLLFPHFIFKKIAGAGHWLHAEKPEIFNQIVTRFVNEG